MPETARRVRRRISAVCKWAVGQGYRQDNPAGEAIGSALPKVNGVKEHHKALPHGEVAGALDRVKATRAHAGTKLAFEFMVLTGCRSGECRKATWTEIDLQDRTWTIPGERTKSQREHVIPLSTAALMVLVEAQKLRNDSDLLFPTIRGMEMSDNAVSKLLRDNEIKAVPHGFRSSFTDWAREQGYSRDLTETALGHVIGGTKGAYHRINRRPMMEKWGEYVTGGKVDLVGNWMEWKQENPPEWLQEWMQANTKVKAEV